METVGVCRLAERGRADAPEAPYHHSISAGLQAADLAALISVAGRSSPIETSHPVLAVAMRPVADATEHIQRMQACRMLYNFRTSSSSWAGLHSVTVCADCLRTTADLQIYVKF